MLVKLRSPGKLSLEEPSAIAIHPKYRADIDGLRALAVVSVVIFHAFPHYLAGGFVGVDIFFVISGFLISSILLGSLGGGKFSFADFYARRVRRIFPALITVTFSTLVVGWFVFLDAEYRHLGKSIAAGFGFISNIVLWSESGYFDASADYKPYLHLWSLAIEEQFYILWPFILWLVNKKRLSVTMITISVTLLSFSINIFSLGLAPEAAFYSPLSRVWEILLGALLAIWTYKGQKSGKNEPSLNPIRCLLKGLNLNCQSIAFKNCLSIGGLLLVVLSIAFLDKESNFPGWWALLPSVGTALIISGGMDAWLNRMILSHRIIVGLGLISYPLYLWHWPILAFVRIIEGGEVSANFRMILVGISILLAWLTYKFIEKPLRIVGREGPVLRALVYAALTITVFSFMIFKIGSPEFRLKKHNELAREFGEYPHKPFHNESCNKRFPQFKDFSSCLLSKDRDPDLIIIGDSHSQQYYKNCFLRNISSHNLNRGCW
ncbi:MAG: acyltransferase [Sphingobacteriales bacterium]|nr:MAG: acyltransferase [Sphingobacteriales bacterium]